ncbi:MAG: leucine-rich repeat domain-containing protein [Eubacteriales bacterium]
MENGVNLKEKNPIKGMISGIVRIVIASILVTIVEGLDLANFIVLLCIVIPLLLLSINGMYKLYSSIFKIAMKYANNSTLAEAGRKLRASLVCGLILFLLIYFSIAGMTFSYFYIILLIIGIVAVIWYYRGMYLLHKALYQVAIKYKDNWMAEACRRSWMMYIIANILSFVIRGFFQYTGRSKSTVAINWVLNSLDIILTVLMFSGLIIILKYVLVEYGYLEHQVHIYKAKLISLKKLGIKNSLISFGMLAVIVLFGVLAITNYSDKYDFDYETYYNHETDTHEEDKITLTRYTGDRKTVKVPAEIDGKKVIKLGYDLFEGNPHVREIEIEDGVKYIGSEAFILMPNLERLKMPDSIISVEMYAFANCINLEKVKLSSNLGVIGQWAFLNTGIKEITIPGNVEIRKNAFFSCDELNEVIIEGSSSIGEDVFLYCENLESVKLPSNIRDVYSNAFYETPWMNNQEDEFIIVGDGTLLRYIGNDKRVIIPKDVNIIANRAFGNYGSAVIQYDIRYNSNKEYSYPNIREIVLPESIKSIGNYAFTECEGLKKINLPKNLNKIGEHAFEECVKLKEIDLPKELKEIGRRAFRNCDSLKSVKIPEGIEVIEYGTFADCDNLDNMIIPESVTEIEMEAFENCSNLKSIDIPKTVKNIAYDAFYGTPWFEESEEDFLIAGDGILIKYNGPTGSDVDIVIPKGTKVLGEYIFSGISRIGSLTIPEGVESIDYNFLDNSYEDDIAPKIDRIIVLEPTVTVDVNIYDFDGTLVSYKGSETEKYAKEKDIDFEALD